MEKHKAKQVKKQCSRWGSRVY